MKGRRSSRRLSMHLPRSPIRRLAQVVVVVLCGVGFYWFGSRQAFKPAVDGTVAVSLSMEQAIALGRQATPYLLQQYGGLHPGLQARRQLDLLGGRLVARSIVGEQPYRFAFHLLADEQAINVFALPSGDIFMTTGLGARLRTEGEMAGVLAHAMGHVIGRHATTRLVLPGRATLPSADTLAAYQADNPSSPGYAEMHTLLPQLVDMTYDHDEEVEADTLGVRYLSEAGYDPRAYLSALEILEAVDPGRPAFFGTHRRPAQRHAHIQRAIETLFPEGLPANLVK